MPRYKVETKYTFTGYYIVEAENKFDAQKQVKDNCGMTCGNISSSLSNEDCDWEFNVHPTKEIITNITRKGVKK